MTRVSRATVKIGALFFSYFRETLVIFHALAEVVNAVVFKLGKRGHGYHVGGVNDFDLGFLPGSLIIGRTAKSAPLVTSAHIFTGMLG